MKKIILSIIFILIFTSCSYIKINNSLNDESEDSDSNITYISNFNLSAINDNDSQIATEGKYIYYIHPDDNFIYRVNLDGINNEVISKHKSARIFYYGENLYFNEYNQQSSWISCIDTDGSNYRIVYNEKQINNFIIHDDIIYMTVFAEEQNAGYMFGFYKFRLSDGSMEAFDSTISLPHQLGLRMIYDKIYYNVGDITREYDINTGSTRDYNIAVHNMQEFNGYIYSYSNQYISKHELNNIVEYSKVYEISKDCIIKRISVIDNLILLAYVNDYTTSDEKFVYIDVINIDGTNRKNLLNFEYSTPGHYSFESIYILNDRLVVISSDSEYPMFKILDLNGKEIYSLY